MSLILLICYYKEQVRISRIWFILNKLLSQKKSYIHKLWCDQDSLYRAYNYKHVRSSALCRVSREGTAHRPGHPYSKN